MCIQRRVTEAGMGSPPWPHTPGAGTGVPLGWQHSPAPNREQSCRGISWEHKANHHSPQPEPALSVGHFPARWESPGGSPAGDWGKRDTLGTAEETKRRRWSWGESGACPAPQCPYVTVPPRRGRSSLSGFPRSPGPAAAEISLSHWENPSALTHVWNVTEMYVSATVWTAEVDVWSRARLALSVATLCRWLELCSKTWV